jgi:tRNA nucleotidyltransferase/poly(A) polymerase
MNNNIFLKTKEIISSVFMVGGSVRDFLLQKEPKMTCRKHRGHTKT